MRIAMFGTFDIANFGDILFPIVTKAMLNRTGAPVDLRLYSYRAKDADSWHYQVHPIEAFRDDVGETDLTLIGGGHLIHADRMMAPGYKPTHPSIPHPFGFWWLPALASRMAGVPTALHAPSVDAAIPNWADPLYEAFAESVDYVSARDTLSCDRLKKMGAEKVNLVPDSVFSVDTVVSRHTASPAFELFRSEHQLDRPYLIVQPSRALRKHKPQIESLISAATAKGWQVLELPIFQEIVNSTGFYEDAPGLVRARRDPDPLLLAEIIAKAQGVQECRKFIYKDVRQTA